MNRYDYSNKQKAAIAFKKAHSLLSKIQTMMDDGKYCIDIMQQNLAVIGLLKSAHHSLMENHLEGCVKTALTTGSAERKQAMIEEILQVSKLANR
jgi:DNA-binding FrmR family transcriptional regulator